MNASIHPSFPIRSPFRQPRHGAFALVITLLILSLLVVVAVSYLSSMAGERQTADAYTSKTRAEEMAQTGADSAMAILKQSFRDFPDSATVWDPAQSTNTDGSTNEGASLYLRAVPDANGYADPLPAGASAAANAPGGNNPGNPACKNFVLPLISGVPGGRAQLVSSKPNFFQSSFSKGMTLPNVTDPTVQNGTDLNVRRGSGDTQGVIGSPPTWNQTYPKPARAYWVPVKSANGTVTGRYAFWIDDESFRANSSYLGNGTTPLDQPSRPLDSGTPPRPRALKPSEQLTLLGPLTLAGDSDAAVHAKAIVDMRKLYPDNFLPDPLAFVHTNSNDGTSSFTTDKTDLIRYLTTNQSGALNLTRHGTQRLNLNAVVPPLGTTADPSLVAPTSTIYNQVQQIVQTLKFHLPYFGERFYRLTPDLKPATLNANAQVPGSPKTDPSITSTSTNPDYSDIYYYKVAANIVDYLDTDTQPTIIDPGGTIHTSGKPISALNGSGSTTNEIWAQGKEISPYLLETAVRSRPTVATDGNGDHPYDLFLDYYLEFWNMSDRDIYASPQTTDPTLPHLHGATVRVTNQILWELSPSPYGPVPSDDGTYRLSTAGLTDLEIDLSTGVRLNGSSGPAVPCVVFKAGTLTVITTDPDCANYVFYGPPGQSSVSTSSVTVTNPATGKPYGSNPTTTYYCPTLAQGRREYKGTIPKKYKGLEMNFQRDSPTAYLYDYETEATLCNSYGYLDSVPFALDAHYWRSTWYSDTDSSSFPKYHDYSYSSCLMGNVYDTGLHFAVLPSQLGDPRTNNEQLTIQPYVQNGNADQSHYIYGTAADTSLGYYNPSQKPDYFSSANSPTAYPWPDYYTLPTPQYPAVTAPNPMNAVSAPMVVADGPLTSIGQLGDVFDPARLPGTLGAIALSRGGGRTFKIGQRDDRYCGDPTSNGTANATADAVPNSNGWAAWRLADVFSIDDNIELPARININGILRDNGAALLSALQGFVFQPTTNSTDPVIHGDGHNNSSLAGATLHTTASSPDGFSQLFSQMSDRLKLLTPPSAGTGLYTPSGPFFERGELGEIGSSTSALFGMSDPFGTAQSSGSSNKLVATTDTYKTFDHSREELCRRLSEMICTRGDTFTVYTVGQSITQGSGTNAPLKVTGTQRMRVTFRLVPKAVDTVLGGYKDFHPGYNVDPNTGQPAVVDWTNKISSNPNVSDTRFVTARFAKPDHYDAQVLSVNSY